jgi:hypothetical protein
MSASRDPRTASSCPRCLCVESSRRLNALLNLSDWSTASMLNRRSFAMSALTGFFASHAAASGSDLDFGKCEGSCFNTDYFQLGYDRFFWSIFDLAASGKFLPKPSGRRIRPEMISLFGQDRLYRLNPNSIVLDWHRNDQNFQLMRVRFELECGVPVVGCLAVPNSKPRGLILLGHGMGSLPERCFTDAQPDYMKGIGKQLCIDGYAVWCPYILQSGNQPSQNNMASMLLCHGISLHTVSCSSLEAGEYIAKHLAKLHDVRVACYGVSWSSFLALHLEAATKAQRPTVVSGYMRDERQLLSSSSFLKNAGFEFSTYLHFQPSKFKFVGEALASLLCPSPLFIEIGSQDNWNSNTYGRDRIFETMRLAYQSAGKASKISMYVFDGPHEAHGVEARRWLRSLI